MLLDVPGHSKAQIVYSSSGFTLRGCKTHKATAKPRRQIRTRERSGLTRPSTMSGCSMPALTSPGAAGRPRPAGRWPQEGPAARSASRHGACDLITSALAAASPQGQAEPGRLVIGPFRSKLPAAGNKTPPFNSGIIRSGLAASQGGKQLLKSDGKMKFKIQSRACGEGGGRPQEPVRWFICIFILLTRRAPREATLISTR